MTKVTAITNQKGGVGKTTTALNLSYALSVKGKRILLIDFDPQASLSVALGIDGEKIPNIQSLMLSEIEDKELEEGYIVNINENLDLIAGTLDLAGTEASLVNVMSREMILKDVIGKVKNKYNYDYIIIDCSPSLGMLTINALTASDSVIIPVTPEYLPAKGLILLIKSILKIKKRLNSNISIDGLLITMMNERLNLSKNMINSLENTTDTIREKIGLDIKIFKSKIPISVRTGEAILQQKSVIEYEPENKVSKSYQSFADEWINK